MARKHRSSLEKHVGSSYGGGSVTITRGKGRGAKKRTYSNVTGSSRRRLHRVKSK